MRIIIFENTGLFRSSIGDRPDLSEQVDNALITERQAEDAHDLASPAPPASAKGFGSLLRRCVVGRTLAWIIKNCRFVPRLRTAHHCRRNPHRHRRSHHAHPALAMTADIHLNASPFFQARDALDLAMKRTR